MDSCFRMIRSNFLSREDRRELLSCVKRQREDHGVARRANALLLLDDKAVYFVDAVHPEYQSKPAFGWVKKGTNPTLKTMCGRPPHCKEYLAQSHPGRVQSCVRPIDAVFTS